MKKLHPISLAKFQAVLFGLLGLLFGVIYSFGGLAIDTLVSLDLISSSETPGLSYGTVLAFGALVGMPFLGLIIGFVTGLVEAILFNLFTKCFGKINIQLK